MKVELAFKDPDAREILFFLRRRYKSKADLEALAKKAIREVVGLEAQKYLDELRMEQNEPYL